MSQTLTTARLVLRPANCTSELFGPSKYDRSDLSNKFIQQGISVLRLIRVLDENTLQISKILRDVGAEV